MTDIWSEPDPDANRDQRWRDRQERRANNGYYADPQNDTGEDEDDE